MNEGDALDFARAREEMVRTQIEHRGITDSRVLAAMRKVPRHEFVPPSKLNEAYEDAPLSIGCGQTISQPYIVAYMTEELNLRGTEKVLEIGTGSGYQTAILAELASEVLTIEVIEELSRAARLRLETLGYTNVRLKVGNGWKGWPAEAPFDGIIVTAAPESDPLHLVDQLKDNSNLIVPVGAHTQMLKRVTRRGAGFESCTLMAVRFVPLV